MTTADDIITLRGLIPDHGIAMLSSGTPGGEIHSRPLATQEIDDLGRCWFVVNTSAAWVAGLQPDEPVNLGYTDDDRRTWVSIAGEARILADRARIDRYGDEHDIGDDARLLAVTPSTVEFWDAPSGRLKALVVKASNLVGRGQDDHGSTTLDL